MILRDQDRLTIYFNFLGEEQLPNNEDEGDYSFILTSLIVKMLLLYLYVEVDKLSKYLQNKLF